MLKFIVITTAKKSSKMSSPCVSRREPNYSPTDRQKKTDKWTTPHQNMSCTQTWRVKTIMSWVSDMYILAFLHVNEHDEINFVKQYQNKYSHSTKLPNTKSCYHKIHKSWQHASYNTVTPQNKIFSLLVRQVFFSCLGILSISKSHAIQVLYIWL